MNDDFELYKPVKLLENINDYTLRKGWMGTIIYIYKKERIYEVEFITQEGTVLEIVTLEANQVQILEKTDLVSLKRITLLVSDEL